MPAAFFAYVYFSDRVLPFCSGTPQTEVLLLLHHEQLGLHMCTTMPGPGKGIINTENTKGRKLKMPDHGVGTERRVLAPEQA
jgi:hypothetical protein